MLGVDGDAVGLEVVEIGAGGDALSGGVPPVAFVGDVDFVVDTAARAVIDGELAVLEAVVFQQSHDDKAVVGAVAVGRDHVGEGEVGVAAVAVPEDMEVVVDGAVAARLVVEVDDIVRYGVVKHGCKNCIGTTKSVPNALFPFRVYISLLLPTLS